RLDFMSAGRRVYTLRDGFANAVIVAPLGDVAANFETEAMSMLGQEVQVSGIFQATSAASFAQGRGGEPRGMIQFWKYTGPPEKGKKGPIDGKLVSLESLVTSPGKRDGQTIKVVGK